MHLVKAATAALTEAADGELGSRLAPAGAADGDERAAPLLEQRPGGAREPHMGEEFQRVAVLPIGVGELEEIAALGGAGIVDQNIERAELALAPARPAFAGASLPRRSMHGDGGAPALLADGGCDLVERLFVASGQHHVAALGRQRQREPRPMPRLDPVTSAILPFNPRSIVGPPFC